MQKRLESLFWVGFAALWGWITLNSVLRWQYNGPAALTVGAVLAAGVWALARWALPRLNTLSPRRWRAFFYPAFALYAIAFAVMAWFLAEVPIMDQAVVLRSLPDLLDDGRFGFYGSYYITCNNNLGLALVLGGWYGLAGLFGFSPDPSLMGVAPAIALNVLALLASAALLCLLARRIFQTNAAVALVFLLCAAFAPFWLYSPCFYSDTLSIPFVLLALLAFEAWQRGQSRARLLLAAGAGAAVFAGSAVKGSVAVLAVALAILFLLRARPRQALASLAAMLTAVGLLTGGYRLWQRVWLIDWTYEEAVGLPMQLWFCYGSHADGNYAQEDYEAAMTVDTIAERKTIINARIAANYAAHTPLSLAQFLTRKAAITWGDGLYNAEEFLATPQRANWTHRFILKGQPGYMPMVYYCQSYFCMVQLLVLAAAVRAVRRRAAGPLLLTGVGVTGLILFLSLWETKARYAFNFTPLLLLLTAAALQNPAMQRDTPPLFRKAPKSDTKESAQRARRKPQKL